jgi:predicted transcriptional regulator of viral defense system
MQTEKDNTIQVKRLSSDTNYYNNVFKKTEKIVSVIFYILSETKVTPSTETHIQTIKDRALKTHELSLETLTLQTHEQHEGLLRLQYGLVALESTLRIAHMARVIPRDIFNLLVDQLDAVLRYINNHYFQNEGVKIEELTEVVIPKTSVAKAAGGSAARQRRVNIPAGDISTDAYLVYSQLTDRAERIKTVLEAKPQATIKDIAEVITDVSEKTIQRELNSLIEKGQVMREGERRWSKYSVQK